MKVSTFWLTAAACWFSILEAQFKLNKISSQTAKFLHLTQALTADIAQEVSNILLAPMSENPYDDLKKVILDSRADESVTFTPTSWQWTAIITCDLEAVFLKTLAS